MADNRSRRPAGSRRPKVAGTRKRATRGRDLQQPEGPDESAEPLSDATASETGENAEAASPDDEQTARFDKRDTESAEASEAPEEDVVEEVLVGDGVAEISVVSDTAEGSGEGGAAPSAEAAEPAEVGADGSFGTKRSAWLPSRAQLVSILVVLTVLFGSLAAWFYLNVRSLREEGPASNEALVERGETSEVSGQVSDAVAKLFSYDFADTGKTERAADKLLVGGAVKEYDQLFSTVKQQAPQQKLVVITTVQQSGVTYLQGDRARVLVFVDQNASRNGKPGNVVPAQISVGAEKHGENWKINQITQK